MHQAIKRITEVFNQRGSDQYGTEEVTQLQHALQSGLLAKESGAPDPLIVAALLHDIGHIFNDDSLPSSSEENFDDKHEFVANAWLKKHFGSVVADPIRLHVVAKRYLCTKYPHYESELSPTSLKSYHDQGGPMTEKEINSFEQEPLYREALELRKWDDLAKDQHKTTPDIDHFIMALEGCLISDNE